MSRIEQSSCGGKLTTDNASSKNSRLTLLRQRLHNKRRFVRTEGPDKPVSHFADSEFMSRVRDRIGGKKLEDLIFVELFSGTAGLCAEVRRLGLSSSVGVDAHISKQTKSPVLRIDMTTSHGMDLVWRILLQNNCVACHMGPPCGTSSRARDIRRAHGPDPKPLRSETFPNGLPTLKNVDRRRVELANVLYQQCAKIFEFCCREGILATIENPGNSYFWLTTYMKQLHPSCNYFDVMLHHCMYGSERRKLTRLRANFEQLQKLGVRCNNQHKHAKWGLVKSRWATSLEVEYPHALCKAWARVFIDTILELGAIPPPLQLSELDDHSLRQSQAAASKQPRGKKLPPLVKEFKQVCKLVGPQNDMWQQSTTENWCVPSSIMCTPYLPVIPAGSKLLRSQIHGEKSGRANMEAESPQNDHVEQQQLVECAVGIPWEPNEFVEQAKGLGHPKLFVHGVPKILESTIRWITNETPCNIAKFRSAVAMRWTKKALELKDAEEAIKDDMPLHCRKVLADKRLALFDAMLIDAAYGDTKLVSDICKGFDLMGPLPKSCVFLSKHTFATITSDQVRSVCGATRQAVWHSLRRVVDRDIAEDIYRITSDEVERGWLSGPLDIRDLMDNESLTRRFGISQTSSSSDGVQTKKTRPIDDFTESLINLTNSSSEKIDIHSVDVILASILMRLRLSGFERKELCAKAIDLRKAYKQLPLSEAALRDGNLAVLNPGTGKPEAFKCYVLPFGARAAVQAFCRCSHALWFAGVALFGIHWTCYFDDFLIIEEKEICRHTSMVAECFFKLLGWATSEEKDAGFLSVARVLGVCIDLSDSRSGIVSTYNTEARRLELISFIDGLLERGHFGKGELATLRGRLLFAENQIFGKGCTVYVRILSRYVESYVCGAVDKELSFVLSMLRDRISHGKPRSVCERPMPVVHVYSDACFELDGRAGIGGVVVDQFGSCIAHFGYWMTTEEIGAINTSGASTIIAELETLAVYISLKTFSSYLAGNDVVVFCDNSAALASLISGRSSNEWMMRIIQSVFMWEDDNVIGLWYERVPSHANVADAPSRGDYSLLAGSKRFDVSVLDTLKDIPHLKN